MDTHILRSQVPSLLEVLAKMILTGMTVWVLEPYVLSGLLAFPRPLPILGEHTGNREYCIWGPRAHTRTAFLCFLHSQLVD